jgi:hypothetical protein
MVPPEVEAYFERQRREQASHVKMTVVASTLRDTMSTMALVIDKTQERGVQLEETEIASQALLDSSRAFVIAAVPWWRRIFSYCRGLVPPWWCE